MGMRNVDIYDPGDPFAKDCYDTYWAYEQVAGRLPNFPARAYAWRYEPDTWFMAFVTVVMVCASPGVQISYWTTLPIAIAIGVYWPLAYWRQPRPRRLYKKMRRRLSILRVPTFLYDFVNATAAKQKGLTDWGEWPSRRFALLRDILLEESAILGELWNDCGCEGSCGHENRLPNRTRKEMRRILREKADAKIGIIAAAHMGALEANRLRIKSIKAMLDQDRGSQLPPSNPSKKEET